MRLSKQQWMRSNGLRGLAVAVAMAVLMLARPVSLEPVSAAEPKHFTQERSAKLTQPKKPDDPGSYCGVHAIYLGIRLCGRPIPFRTLVDRKYISSREEGSSLADLVRAATDAGAHSLAHAPSLAGIRYAYLSNLVPQGSAPSLGSQISAGDVTVADARWLPDYVAGYIEGAFNIPPDATPDQASFILASIPKSKRLVVYCQSKTCPYSNYVARALFKAGYTNLSLFEDGWVGWSAAKGQKQQ